MNSRTISVPLIRWFLKRGFCTDNIWWQVALTKVNEHKSATLKKQNDELGYMFLPTEVEQRECVSLCVPMCVFVYVCVCVDEKENKIDRGKRDTVCQKEEA